MSCVLFPSTTHCKYTLLQIPWNTFYCKEPFCVFTNQPTKCVQSTTNNKVNLNLYVSSDNWYGFPIKYFIDLLYLSHLLKFNHVFNQTLNAQQYQLHHIIDVQRAHWASKWAATEHSVRTLMRLVFFSLIDAFQRR